MGEIVMPRLSDTMEEGTILRWLKAEGEEVRRGEELVEIETDKATMTYESDQEGVLQILAPEGETLSVGEPIARVGGVAADRAAADAETSPPEVIDGDGPAPGGPAGLRSGGETGPQSIAHAPAASPEASPEDAPPLGERIKASPLARRIAQESGVDLHTLTGSGPGGRIVKADVTGRDGSKESEQAPAGSAAASAGPQTTSIEERVATAKGETTVLQLSRLQQAVARRMAESKATIPHFTLATEVDMGACVRLRTELKRLARPDAPTEAGGGGRTDVPTYNDMVVKAAALALREHPRANGSYRDGALQLHSRVNVGVAVAAEDALVVPTIFDAEEKSLGEISRETRALAERVRAATITPPELGGGTFTVSNLGMYGVSSFTAIINPPQAAILSVGSLEARAVVSDGEIVSGHTMTLTLACDHRILYGADAAEFLKRIRELLETPSALTL